ncbi:MerR family transcriptional regulator [Nocardia gipuzkoensis]
MRIAELSRRSGVSVPTIKYYLREGLLVPGERTGPNQASYSDEHLRRLRLIRALIEVGGMSVAAVGDVLAAVDEPELPVFSLLGVVEAGLATPSVIHDEHDQRRRMRAEVEQAIRRRGWGDADHAPAVGTLTGVLVRLAQLGYERWISGALDVYLDAAELVADVDVDYALEGASRDEIVDAVVVLTTLGETALSAARRIAHQEASARKLKVRRSSSP